MSRKIVAIGGGKLEKKETLPIDKHIVKLTEIHQPNALFIPTASYDDEDYWKDFKQIYNNQLHCSTEVLYLLNNPPSYPQIKARIKQADLIYVGGGNTLKLMRRWRHLGVDSLIKNAYNRGTVCSGLSAGALCWFLYGHSDSMYYYHPQKDWQYIRVRGLGVVPLTLCPHYDGEQREQYFQDMIQKKGHVGVALDDKCALEIIEDQYRIITSDDQAQAYKVIKKDGQIYQTTIPKQHQYSPLEELLRKDELEPWGPNGQ